MACDSATFSWLSLCFVMFCVMLPLFVNNQMNFGEHSETEKDAWRIAEKQRSMGEIQRNFIIFAGWVIMMLAIHKHFISARVGGSSSI